MVLINSSSTYNFLDLGVLSKTRLPCNTKEIVRVKMANGAVVNSEEVATKIPFLIQAVKFEMQTHVLNLVGCNIVFGDPRLQTLGNIHWNFLRLTMQIFHDVMG